MHSQKSLAQFPKRIFPGDDNLQKPLKDSVFHIVCERNLCSCMNNTKWCELINAIKMEMPFILQRNLLHIAGSKRKMLTIGEIGFELTGKGCIDERIYNKAGT